MQIPFIDLKVQQNQIEEEIHEAVRKVFSSCNFVMGEEVEEFEKNFANYLGVKHAIAVGNGTDALVIALHALNIGKDDEVITTPFTFFATAESIAAVGAKPVFVDVDKRTFNIDISKIEKEITPKTKAIMPVHLFGQPANMHEIMELSKKHQIKVIEDACQAIGAEYKGRKVGSFGDAGCFSFFPTKNLGCAGDGGLIATNDDQTALMARALRGHGSGKYGKEAYELIHPDMDSDRINTDCNNTMISPEKYYNYLIGTNSRLDTLQAAILNIKLKYIDRWNEQRINHANCYNECLQKNPLLVTPFKEDAVKHVYHLYVLQSEARDQVVKILNHKGISTGIYYPIPLHLQKAFKYLNYKKGDLPNSELLAQRTFAIPIYPELTMEQVEYIIHTINTTV